MIVNGLAGANKLGGKSNKQISDEFAVSIAPAGFAFAIWGLIYLLLG